MAMVSSPSRNQYVYDEATSQLQRRLAQESADREAAMLQLHRLKTVVDFYRQRLQTLTARPLAAGVSSDSTVWQRARDLVRDMDAEVHNLGDGSPGGGLTARSLPMNAAAVGSPKAKSYEVLRQSLDEAQRRCESLNSDMLQQAEANEELVETLSTVKDANKRHLEQIRQQTLEISALAQQRVADEEKMDQMTRRHEQQREAFHQESHRQLQACRDAGAERHNQVYLRLTDKLRHVKARSELIMQDASRLAQDLRDRRADALTIMSVVQGSLRAAEKDLGIKCEIPKNKHEQNIRDCNDSIGDLHVQLAAEREARHGDGLHWAHKHGSLSTEKEDVHARHTRNHHYKTTHHQASERSLHAARQCWADERPGLDKKVDELHQMKHTGKMTIDQLQRDIVSLETALSSTTSEIACLEKVTQDLRRQSRESDDALAAAISGNEHLRTQMEEQRQRFQEKNELDLSDTRAQCEQKLADVHATHDSEVVMATKQLEAMDLDYKEKEEDRQRIELHLDNLADEIAAHHRDTHLWRSQSDAAHANRDVLEREHHEGKQLFHGERLKLVAGVDQMSRHSTAFDDEIKTLTADLHEIKRTSAAKETAMATRHAAGLALLRDHQEAISDLKGRLKDATEQRARLGGESAQTRERMLDSHMALERHIDGQRKVLEEERRRRTDHLHSERRTAEQVRGEFEREREITSGELRRVHDESREKLTGVERERARILETSRAEIQQMTQAIAQQQAQAKMLESDLARVQALHMESESNASWVRLEHEHQERETGHAIRQLHEEVTNASSLLEQARREDGALAQQLDEHRRRNEQDRVHLRKALDGITSPPAPAPMDLAAFRRPGGVTAR